MAGLLSLPTELILRIIELLVVPNASVPTIGSNAAWTPVYKIAPGQPARMNFDASTFNDSFDSDNNEDLGIVPQLGDEALPPVHPITAEDIDGPDTDDDHSIPSIQDETPTTIAYEIETDSEGSEPQPARTVSVTYSSALKALRQYVAILNRIAMEFYLTIMFIRTTRLLNQLVLPFLFEELNLFEAWEPNRLLIINKFISQPYGQYIRTLRTYMDSLDSNAPNRPLSTLVSILRGLPSLRSLGLYYFYGSSDFTEILNEVTPLLEHGVLDEIGLYSMTVLNAVEPLGELQWRQIHGIDQFIKGIAAPPFGDAIRKLEIVTESMEKSTYDILRSKSFPNLTHLTIRHSFRRNLWEDDLTARDSWVDKNKLTRLQIINCQTAYAPDIPIIIRHFEALEELTISTCGWRNDAEPPKRKSGWSHRSDALCNMRKPLRWFKLEHMIQWEIEALGAIPAREVTVVNADGRQITRALRDDPELFPGITTLRLFSEWEMLLQDWRGNGNSYIKELKELAQKRGITIKNDAERMMVCACCFFDDDIRIIL